MKTKMKLGKILSFGMAAVTSNMVNQFNSLFLLVFLTDALGINPLLAGTAYTAVGWLSAGSDTVVGIVSDRTGHYKRWVFWGTAISSVLFCLVYVNLDIPQTLKTVYAFTMFLLFTFVTSCYIIPYNAMTSALTTDGETRTKLNASRFAFLTIPAIAISIVTPYLSGGQTNGTYTIAAIIFGIIAFAFVLPCAIFVEEPEMPVEAGKKQTLKASLKSIVGNKQLLLIGGTYFVYALGFYIYMSTMNYFFQYNYGSMTMMSKVLLMNAPLSLVVSLSVPFVIKALGKKKSLVVSALVFAAAMLMIMMFPTNGIIVFAGNFVALFLLNLMSPMLTIMMMDAIDYGVWQTGENVRAVSFAGISVMGRVATGLSGTVIGVCLTAFGYVANAQQTQKALLGIRISYCLVPVLLFICISIAIGIGWKLSEKKMEEIATDLELRKN